MIDRLETCRVYRAIIPANFRSVYCSYQIYHKPLNCDVRTMQVQMQSDALLQVVLNYILEVVITDQITDNKITRLQ